MNGNVMTADSNRSPAASVMGEAIDLAIKGRSPSRERAAFIDADTPSADHDMKRAADCLLHGRHILAPSDDEAQGPVSQRAFPMQAIDGLSSRR